MKVSFMNDNFNDTPFRPAKRSETVRVLSYVAERAMKFNAFARKFEACPRKMRKGVTVWNELQSIDFDDRTSDIASLKNNKAIHNVSFTAREIVMANVEFLDFIEMGAVGEKFG